MFPAGTDVHVHRKGTRLMAPGIGDDTQALALLVALARAMRTADIHTVGDVLFVADVGEEGPGNLRGIRHLFAEGAYRRRIRQFVSLDGAGDGSFITNVGVGSRRYHVAYTGPGGHSYGAFGLVSPANALADAINKLAALNVPSSPRTTYNVGRLGGGTAVNAIPSQAWMDVDLRSRSPAELETLDETFRSLAEQAAQDENRARSTSRGSIEVHLQVLGERPSGSTGLYTRLVEVAAAATRTLGRSPNFSAGSTDANLPMSLGIPAITLDTGVAGGRPHAPDEWIDVDRRVSFAGLERTLLVVLTLAGVE